ncbi:MAG: SDR family oxidoreductase, partial [Alphaproteobacteria bacterium]|nr:SDR family oxidoreductase [Alphaproteobacteria bacterium]
KNIIFFAANKKKKSIHYVSALSAINDHEGDCIIENFPNDDLCKLRDGYSQTKWVSEYLLKQARDEGLTVLVYRPPTIWGDSVTNNFQMTNDHQALLIKTYFSTRMVPDLNREIIVLPVDLVSNFIIKMAESQKFGCESKVYNMVPYKRYKSVELQAILQDILGDKVRLVEATEWIDYIIKNGDGLPIYPLLSIYSNIEIRKLALDMIGINERSNRNFCESKNEINSENYDFMQESYFRSALEKIKGE